MNIGIFNVARFSELMHSTFEYGDIKKYLHHSW